MGCPKLTLPAGDVPLGSLALRTALSSRLDDVIVVTREDDGLRWIAPSLLSPPWHEKWRAVRCACASRGQAHSLRCGLRAARESGAEAVVMLLADQPFVSRELIDELIFRYAQSVQNGTPADYVAASHKGLPRPPALFSSRLFPELGRLRGDEGARRLLRGRPLGEDAGNRLGIAIECGDPRVFDDIDTEEDYRFLLESLETKA